MTLKTRIISRLAVTSDSLPRVAASLKPLFKLLTKGVTVSYKNTVKRKSKFYDDLVYYSIRCEVNIEGPEAYAAYAKYLTTVLKSMGAKGPVKSNFRAGANTLSWVSPPAKGSKELVVISLTIRDSNPVLTVSWQIDPEQGQFAPITYRDTF